MYTFRGISLLQRFSAPGSSAVRRQGKKNQQLLTRPTVREKNKCREREKKIIALSIDLWDGKPIYVITFDIYV